MTSRSITQICLPDTPLHWTFLFADDSLFAIVGGLQMFGLHETAGSSYVPPNILVYLSQLHKKGTFYLPPRKVSPPNSVKLDGAKLDGRKLEVSKPTQASRPPNLLPMKMFFAVTALALAVSTCTAP
jgi:hypothetical protein